MAGGNKVRERMELSQNTIKMTVLKMSISRRMHVLIIRESDNRVMQFSLCPGFT